MTPKSKWTLSGVLGTLLILATAGWYSPTIMGTFSDSLISGTTNYRSKVVAQSSRTEPTCASSTGDGYICAENGIESEGTLDVAGNAAIVGTLTVTGEYSATGGIDLADDADIDLGTGDDFLITFDATTQAPDSAYVGVGTESRQLVIAETADVGTDLTIAQQTNPTINIHSADSADAADYLLIAHDQSNAALTSGRGGFTATGATLTSGGTNDYGLHIAQVLNDSGAAGGTDLYNGILIDITETDVTGWDTVNLMDLQVGSASKFLVNNSGNVTAQGSLGIVSQTIGVPFSNMRVFDNTAALLPVAGATDDLGQVNGTLGTNAPSLQTEDLKAAGATNNSAYFEWVVPASYVAGSTVTLRMHAGMLTTAADTTATLDAECWVPDYANDDGTVSTDLVTPAAQSINSTTLADIDFVIDDDLAGHVLAAGSLVQCKITTAVNDGATGTAVIGIIRKIDILLST